MKVYLENLPARQVLLHHYRIDNKNSNAYQVWKAMGSPQNPSDAPVAELEKAGPLQLLILPVWIKTGNGNAVLEFGLPRQGDELNVEWEGMGRPLKNILQLSHEKEEIVSVTPLH